ncbi:hypothetical protein CKAH01_08518 [Colletotrichum kahawae]|uniref:Uncharacterized protein n=1 Tax=Colletotrichum kahawae TaxID=34407 RepID=A0AAE0D014_COLKA|nr:hypothetical protein CKAH01_08518 [Colletotrichum kahawae]
MTQALILISPSSSNIDKEPPTPDDVQTCGGQGCSSLAGPPEKKATFSSSRKAPRADATNASSHRTEMPSVTPNQLKTATPHEPSQSPSTVFHQTKTLPMYIMETTGISSRRGTCTYINREHVFAAVSSNAGDGKHNNLFSAHLEPAPLALIASDPPGSRSPSPLDH